MGVALMFAGFGLHTLLTRAEDEDGGPQPRRGGSVLITTFLVIFIAEFGDKTQIAVAGLSTTASPAPVWMGATAGLLLTTALGVAAGRVLLQRIPLRLLKALSGVLFLLLAAAALVPVLYRG